MYSLCVHDYEIKMDRKTCVIVYSTYSEACRSLIDYIGSFPYDLPRVTGMTFLNADTSTIRHELLKRDVSVVPTLLVEYYNGLRQKFENDEIYVWLHALNAMIMPTVDRNVPVETSRSELSTTVDADVMSTRDDSTAVDAKSRASESIMTKALSLQKDRDLAVAASDPVQKLHGK